jgi:hypothetical protein
MIAVVILNHNEPEKADRIYEKMAGVFDKVELWDSGSENSNIPINVTDAFDEDIGHLGAWQRIVGFYSSYDAVWLIDSDMEPNDMKESMPFGVWSGDGVSFALSGDLMQRLKEAGELPEEDASLEWFCEKSERFGLRNVIGGQDAVQKKESDVLTIVTVDNGWGVEEFVDIVSKFPNASSVLMQKGSSSLDHLAGMGIKVVPYYEDMAELIKIADIALFTKVGPANEKEYRQLVAAGVPTVVHVGYAYDLIEHEKNGFVFGNLQWAESWVRKLIDDDSLRSRIGEAHNIAEREETPVQSEPDHQVSVEQAADITERDEINEPMVTVITPTYHRELKVVRRSTDCLKLQDMKDWEQLICSNGELEPNVRQLVKELDDGRVSYHWCDAPKGDYGNYARRDMLKRARGKYVLFLDDDNVIMPNYLNVMISILEDSGADAAVCRVMHFGPLNESETGMTPPVVLTGIPVKLYNIDPLQFLVRREVMQSIGWDTDSGYISDGVTLEKLAGRPMVEVPLVLGIHI